MKSSTLFRSSALICALFFFFGCTTSPPFPSKTVNVVDINNAILTELYCAATDLEGNDKNKDHYWTLPANFPPNLYFASKDNWVVGVDLYVSTSIEGVANPAVSLLGPFNMARAVSPGGTTGTFTALFGGSVDHTRTNLREYKLYVYLPELIKQWQPPANCNDPNHGHIYLAGNLGLENWLGPAVVALENTQPLAPNPSGNNGVVGSLSSQKNRFAKREHNIDLKGLKLAENQPGDSHKIETDAAPLSAAQATQLTNAINDFVLFAGNPGGTGSGQSPTISTTITFTIKTGGTLGPSFALTRVSGGSGSAFTLTRTDNNYVNIVLTPATYCPTPFQVQGTSCAVQTTPGHFTARSLINNGYPTSPDMQAATARIDAALVNLNLAHLLSP